jgi:undecaprenyl-diphosphatase
VTWFQAVVLGIVQGATEFLPVSSSGHLVLVPWLLGWQLEGQVFFPFSVVVHWGTVAAVILSMRSDLASVLAAAVRSLIVRRPLGTSESRLAWMLVLASLPAALAGLLFGEQVEQAFGEPRTVGLLLLATATILLIGERLGQRERGLDELGASDSLVVGFGQALALFPGISRSGATISVGLSRGLARVAAARFSFMLAVPIMIGAGAVALLDLAEESSTGVDLSPLLIGFMSAAAVGTLAIRWLLRYLSSGSLHRFAVYCALVGGLTVVLSLIRA